jgi:hypothetical protein
MTINNLTKELGMLDDFFDFYTGIITYFVTLSRLPHYE